MHDNDRMIEEEFVKAKKYWQSRLAEEIVEISLPVDFQRSSLYTKGEYKIIFDEDAGDRLLSLSKNQDVLLYVILLSALKVLMFKYTGEADISIGAPVYIENEDPKYNGKLMVFRDILNNEMTFKGLLLNVKQTVIEGYENQHYVIENILDVLGVTLPAISLPKIVLLLENIHNEKIISDFIHSPANDITLSILKSGNGLTGSIQYNANMFKPDTINRFYTHYLNILKHLLKDINIKLSAVECLTKEEKQQVIDDFNDTGKAYPIHKTLHRLFADRVEKGPDNTAVVYRDIRLTYKELDEKTHRLAKVLRSKGVKTNDILGLMLESGLETVISIIAVLKAGGAYLPIDPGYPADRKTFMLKDSGVKVLLVQEHILKENNALLTDLLPENLLIVDDALSGDEAPPVETNRQPADLAYLIYTSGTTGRPKGILVRHRGIVNYTLWRLETYRYSHRDVTLQMLSYSFDGFGSNFYSSLFSGGVLLMIPDSKKLDIDFINHVIETHRVTNMSLVPPAYRVILDGAGEGGLDSLRFVVLAGEKSSKDLVRKSKEKVPAAILLNEYGPTETTVTAAGHWGIDESNTAVIGRPIANTRIYILDTCFKPVPLKVAGELVVAGMGVARGYQNNPELTANRFIESPFLPGERIYRTGDLARWLPEGHLELLGRIDHQMKIRGYRIEPGEIEMRLLKIKPIKDAVVVEINEGQGGKYLCAYFSAAEEVDIPALRDIFRHDLPEYMIPSYFVQLENIPLTPNGKVDRKALPLPKIEIRKEITPPGNELEKRLVEIWSEVLGIEKNIIGIDSKFFDLGGHSLNATIMVGRIHQELNVKLPLAEVFKSPTIRATAKAIMQLEKNKFSSIESTEKKSDYGLSSAQKRLYIAQQVEPESVVYNIPQIIKLQETDRNRLTETFKKLIKRHENLRTSFFIAGKEPRQKIYEDVTLEVEFYDIGSGATTGSIDEIIRDFVRPFDLSGAPLLRVGLIEVAGNSNILMVDMHHIISDAVSNDILVEDFTALYQGLPLAPLRLHYKDYSEWHNHPARQEILKKQEEYWLKEFEEIPPVLDMPTDYPIPRVQRFEGDTATVTIEQEELTALRQLAADEGGTLFLVLLSIYYIFLSKISSQQDIVIGTTIAGRRHADLERIIGMFVNMLALRNYPQQGMPFDRFLRQVKERTLEAFENQDYPFDDLVKLMALERIPGRNPLFDAAFDLFNIDTDPVENAEAAPGDEDSDSYQLRHGVSRFAFSLTGLAAPGALYLTVEYSTQWFKPETIERFIGYIKEIISQVLENIKIPLQDIKISHDLVTTKKDFLQAAHDFDRF